MTAHFKHKSDECPLLGGIYLGIFKKSNMRLQFIFHDIFLRVYILEYNISSKRNLNSFTQISCNFLDITLNSTDTLISLKIVSAQILLQRYTIKLQHAYFTPQ